MYPAHGMFGGGGALWGAFWGCALAAPATMINPLAATIGASRRNIIADISLLLQLEG